MLFLLLKSSACLAIFMVFYKLCLERTSAHIFKRFYLLAIILISIGIPFITFTEYIEAQPINSNMISGFETSLNAEIYEKSFQDYLPNILWSIYAFGVIIFAFRFFKNLYQIFYKIKVNPKLKSTSFINVLLHDLIHPHTFFNYIFLNKNKYEKNLIPKEVLLHEQTHAKQKHALDILFIEVLQILFWFNPLLHLLKKDIKLNHEFLADNTVLNKGYNTKHYQQLLLAFSSSAAENSLANAINYSLIKKRFTVMKTKTSKKTLWLRSTLLLPLLAITLFGFSNKKQVLANNSISNNIEIPQILFPQENIKHSASDNIGKELDAINNFKKEPVLEISHNPEIFRLNGKLTSLSKLKKDFTRETNDKKSDLRIKTKGGINMSLINKIMATLKSHLIKIKLDESVYIIDDIYLNQTQQKATSEQVAEYNKLAKKYNAQPENKRVIKLADIKLLEYLYGLMSKEQKASAESFPNCPPPPPLPPLPVVNTDNASKEFLKTQAEFHKKSNEYSHAVSQYIKQKQGTITELSNIYSEVMQVYNKYNSLVKKENLFIPPPPAPEPTIAVKRTLEHGEPIEIVEVPKPSNSVKTGTVKINDEEHFYKTSNNVTTYYNRKGTEVDKNGNIISPTIVEIIEVADLPAPPEPPTPISPLDHVIDMAKKGAIFYYNDEKITSDKAIDLLKKNNNLNISSKTNNGVHIIKIQKEPFKL